MANASCTIVIILYQEVSEAASYSNEVDHDGAIFDHTIAVFILD